ncbi:hypothetical protein NA619_23045 [Pseudomonas stutzeri]|nr:hypothetical protein [Stutzerimonas stutzeri]MCQ4260870.1 hypothetical protein [Stutzerimonas stutzeri]
MAMLKALAALFTFIGILAGCLAALLVVLLLVRCPLLVLPVLLACCIFSTIQRSTDKSPSTSA